LNSWNDIGEIGVSQIFVAVVVRGGLRVLFSLLF